MNGLNICIEWCSAEIAWVPSGGTAGACRVREGGKVMEFFWLSTVGAGLTRGARRRMAWRRDAPVSLVAVPECFYADGSFQRFLLSRGCGGFDELFVAHVIYGGPLPFDSYLRTLMKESFKTFPCFIEGFVWFLEKIGDFVSKVIVGILYARKLIALHKID
ncbi:hypothetical protein Tco_0820523 [Tanacetum coccineum]|uniref:Uncharacterized protein n=1 Tax=Tanacetum coccineum TaxID=301880 RepID=A0ABQ5ADZ0_9ASTR